MYKYGTLILLTFLLFSCGTEKSQENVYVETEDIITVVVDTIQQSDILLSHTDSVLAFAEKEMERIKHTNQEFYDEYSTLINTNKNLIRLNNQLSKDLSQKDKDIMELDSIMSHELSTMSIENKYLKKQIEYKNVLIKGYNKTILNKDKYIGIKDKKISILNDSIVTLNDSIISINNAIYQNLKQNRVEKIFGE